MELPAFINHDKWSQILQKFIDVLRINILIVNPQGKSIVVPRSDFLKVKHLVNLFNESDNILTKFKSQGHYLEYKDAYDLFTFAIPLKTSEHPEGTAYMIAGPVILNKKLDRKDYLALSKRSNQNFDEIMNIIDEIRVVSFINLKSILDLLAEVAQYITELSFETHNLSHKIQAMQYLENIYDREEKTQKLTDSILSIALLISEADAGSIMIYDEGTQELRIQASHGLNPEAQGQRIKLGEGIAGIAAQDQETFVIHGTQSHNRISHLLKRPQIKHAIVMPIILDNRMIGVLNLHTLEDRRRIADNAPSLLKSLSQLTSAAFQNIA